MSTRNRRRHPARGAIFHDPTGRRWRWTRAVVLALVLLVAAMAALAWPHATRSPAQARASSSALQISPETVGKPPVVGSGPLLRILAVRAGVGYDPFSGAQVRALSAAEKTRLGRGRWVVDQYGYPAVRSHIMALTFDDGPDPAWTPQLLNLLSREHVRATFFLIGRNASKFPDLVHREVREGHAIANHTLSHPDLSRGDAAAEKHQLVSTDRILRAIASRAANYYRPPYSGTDVDSILHNVPTILRAQRLGYVTANYDFDTDDWQYEAWKTKVGAIPLPVMDGRNQTVLLHDAGGNRELTLQYLPRLIRTARAHGYTFQTLPQAAPTLRDVTLTPSLSDRLTLAAAQAVYVWPKTLLNYLFILAMITFVGGGIMNVSLACWRRWRYRDGRPVESAGLPVSVVIAAYNEQDVIGRTLEALAASRYLNLELLVVDDGSTDGTAAAVHALAARDSRIRLIQQPNSGKSTALNRAFGQARGDIVVTLDADTIVTPDTVPNLIRPFVGDPRLAAVAGVVKVGNQRNLVTRWQALEYLMQIGVDRAASDALGAIMVVPGACAAWRRTAVLRAGGYSPNTLAEDADLCLTLQREGYRVTQADDAYAYTEAPETVRALLKQRLRWTFGNYQALWKHRGMMFRPRYGWLGMFLMPLATFSIVVPLVCLPFVYLITFFAVRAQGFGVLLPWALLFGGIQLVVAAVGVALMKEKPAHLLMVPVHRLVYDPMRAYLLYRSVLAVLSGRLVGWNKLARTGSVAAPARQAELEPA